MSEFNLIDTIEQGCGHDFSIWNPILEEDEGYGICRKDILCPSCEKKKKAFKEFIKKLEEESHTTHSCSADGDNYKCRCDDVNIPDQNCMVIPYNILNKLIGRTCVSQGVGE